MQLDSSISAVVTGGASGLGESVARLLASHGVKVAIFDMNDARGEEVAKSIGGVFCNVNVTSDADVDAGFAKARAALGQERILINCAGTGKANKTASRDKTTGEIKHHPIEDFVQILQINLVGTFRCIAKSAAGMLTLAPANGDGERGVIVNTASVAAHDGQIGQVSYAASKAGIVGLTLPVAGFDGRGDSRQYYSARHLRHAVAGSIARQRASRTERLSALPKTHWVAGRVCVARTRDDSQWILQWRVRASGRRHSHASEMRIG